MQADIDNLISLVDAFLALDKGLHDSANDHATKQPMILEIGRLRRELLPIGRRLAAAIEKSGGDSSGLLRILIAAEHVGPHDEARRQWPEVRVGLLRCGIRSKAEPTPQLNMPAGNGEEKALPPDVPELKAVRPLSPSRENAYRLDQFARETLGENATHRQVYDYLDRRLAEENCPPPLNAMELPPWSSWRTYVSQARKHYRTTAADSKAAQKVIAKSVVSSRRVDDPVEEGKKRPKLTRADHIKRLAEIASDGYVNPNGSKWRKAAAFHLRALDLPEEAERFQSDGNPTELAAMAEQYTKAHRA